EENEVLEDAEDEQAVVSNIDKRADEDGAGSSEHGGYDGVVPRKRRRREGDEDSSISEQIPVRDASKAYFDDEEHEHEDEEANNHADEEKDFQERSEQAAKADDGDDRHGGNQEGDGEHEPEEDEHDDDADENEGVPIVPKSEKTKHQKKMPTTRARLAEKRKQLEEQLRIKKRKKIKAPTSKRSKGNSKQIGANRADVKQEEVDQHDRDSSAGGAVDLEENEQETTGVDVNIGHNYEATHSTSASTSATAGNANRASAKSACSARREQRPHRQDGGNSNSTGVVAQHQQSFSQSSLISHVDVHCRLSQPSASALAFDRMRRESQIFSDFVARLRRERDAAVAEREEQRKTHQE
ncbi:unnamed protein product, partial [Amoebophrya sp. A25]